MKSALLPVFLTFVALTSTIQAQGSGQESGKACSDKAADIYFLLDTSNSVWPNHFYHQVLPFVRDVVSEFYISPQHTRVGLVTYSNIATHEIGLSDYTNLQDLLDVIQPGNIEYLSGLRTNTGDAIRCVLNDGFKGNDTRHGAAQIMITVTDGHSQESVKTAEAAAEAKQSGVLMFVVGVGNDTNTEELHAISSDPDEDFNFHVESFSTLGSLTDKLARKTCRAVTVNQTPNQSGKAAVKTIEICLPR